MKPFRFALPAIRLFGMSASESGFDFRGLAGQITEMPFEADALPHGIHKKLTHSRYAWLTTVSATGMPSPTLVWFWFEDTGAVTVYSHPRSSMVRQIFEHPHVSLHLESDGLGGGLVIMGGKAAVTAEGVDPRDDKHFWAKYHVEAHSLGIHHEIADYSAKIEISPMTLWTTAPA